MYFPTCWLCGYLLASFYVDYRHTSQTTKKSTILISFMTRFIVPLVVVRLLYLVSRCNLKSCLQLYCTWRFPVFKPHKGAVTSIMLTITLSSRVNISHVWQSSCSKLTIYVCPNYRKQFKCDVIFLVSEPKAFGVQWRVLTLCFLLL